MVPGHALGDDRTGTARRGRAPIRRADANRRRSRYDGNTGVHPLADRRRSASCHRSGRRHTISLPMLDASGHAGRPETPRCVHVLTTYIDQGGAAGARVPSGFDPVAVVRRTGVGSPAAAGIHRPGRAPLEACGRCHRHALGPGRAQWRLGGDADEPVIGLGGRIWPRWCPMRSSAHPASTRAISSPHCITIRSESTSHGRAMPVIECDRPATSSHTTPCCTRFETDDAPA